MSMVITLYVGMLVSTNVYAELQDNQNYSQTEMGVGWRVIIINVD